VDVDRAREYLSMHHHSVLSTFRSDGRPQLSPVVHAVATDDRVFVSSREPAYKVRNIRRDPRVSLCAFSDGFFGDWVQVDGTAEVVSLPAAMDLLVETYRQISGEHPDWDDYRAAMTRDRRVIIAIDVDRAGPDYSA
jgi:PPOX class probable F420-dependent enzyme